ncbi:pyridoxal-phosphate-dependent aminotransferase family protein [Agrobacterium larrymoorei]|uniref:Aspartate aminotransferase-like enzyme n=1 Tax=Agrobacterium larrymoorei TaxID=160699 RepID=A0ABU0UFY3_9HYPH|nr:aminotransferase class V-fold PLP-dependent enzyme [Agrobacterium larrymoorei]MDQ1183829.1 aspartate aminotransferase-like enzyme [Agrobacterium larrymoorei]
MPDRNWSHLLDVPAFPPERYAKLADRLAALMKTRNDVLLIQAEAVLALEAVATSLARPGLKALNIVTSPYGAWFGDWLKRGGSDVINLVADLGRPIAIEAVRQQLDENPNIAVLSLVHAESATGILNPLEDIVRLARERGVLTVVDAVASIGGHALNVDENGIDVVVIGPQKSLAGPAGVSAISVSERAWAMLRHESAPRNSMLSLLDQKEQWLETGRGVLPGTPAPLEFFALDAALDRLEAEGIDAVQARHHLAAKATREALVALGAELWVDDTLASALVTAVRLPADIDRNDLLLAARLDGADIGAAVGPGSDRLVRLNHTGRRASKEAVLANIKAFAQALHLQGRSGLADKAVEAVDAFYSSSGAK